MSLVHVQQSALPSVLFRRLRSGLSSLGQEGIRSTYQTTFWFDFGQPQSVVDETILRLRHYLPDHPLAGVEWWLSRMRTTNVGVDFHQDRDESLARRTGVQRHPTYSSVLFLNRVRGGALAVTGQLPNHRNPCNVPLPLDADLVSPYPNRLVWFEGRLTHGVLDADNHVPVVRSRRAGQLRLTVVMNWWLRRPTEVPMFQEVGVYPALRLGTSIRRARRPVRRAS